MKASILIISIAFVIAIVAADDGPISQANNPMVQVAETYIGGGGPLGGNGAYLFLDGVTGDVTALGHEGWIEVSSFNYSIIGQRASMSSVQSEVEQQHSELGDLIVSKSLDKTSPQIYLLACKGDPKDAKLDIVRNGATVMQYVLTNAVISGVQVLGGGVGNGQKPQEVIALSYTKIEWKVTEPSEAPVESGWDLATNQEV